VRAGGSALAEQVRVGCHDRGGELALTRRFGCAVNGLRVPAGVIGLIHMPGPDHQEGPPEGAFQPMGAAKPRPSPHGSSSLRGDGFRAQCASTGRVRRRLCDLIDSQRVLDLPSDGVDRLRVLADRVERLPRPSRRRRGSTRRRSRARRSHRRRRRLVRRQGQARSSSPSVPPNSDYGRKRAEVTRWTSTSVAMVGGGSRISTV
jgi:hypothetical protein